MYASTSSITSLCPSGLRNRLYHLSFFSYYNTLTFLGYISDACHITSLILLDNYWTISLIFHPDYNLSVILKYTIMLILV